MVRGLANDKALDGVQDLLPQEAYEALFFYAAGDSYENILLERELEEASTFDSSNYTEALSRLQSMAHFVVPKDDEALSEMLNAPMEKWRVFLHPTQRKYADSDRNGSFKLLGGAGTGKTVVAMHRAKWLAGRLIDNGDNDKKLLFTTFTRNLAVDIESNLQAICGKEEMARIRSEEPRPMGSGIFARTLI